MRFLSFLVAGFLLLTSFESWAITWLAGRWFFNPRYVSLKLSIIKNWLDRGIITRTSEKVKIFVNKNGKWIILTVAISPIIRELENLENSAEYCYVETSNTMYSAWTSWGTLSIHHSGNWPSRFYEVKYSSVCRGSYSLYLPAVEIRHWFYVQQRRRNEWVRWAEVPKPGTYTYTCNDRSSVNVEVSLKVSRVCPSDVTQPPADIDLERDYPAPVRIFPKVDDFIRPDLIESDPSLRYLRDEYYRIARDNAIPDVTPYVSGIPLPRIGWEIPPEEAVDSSAESSRDTPRPSTDAPPRESDRPEDRERDRDRSDDLPAVPGLDTNLPSIEKRPFPLELINQLVENHPLLRILRSVSLDAAGGGSCVFGSQPFIIDMCGWVWVLNLMGSFLVPLAFLYGLGIGGRND